MTEYISRWSRVGGNEIRLIKHDPTVITPGDRKDKVRTILIGQVKLEDGWSSFNFDEVVDALWADKMAERDQRKRLKIMRYQQLVSKK